MIGQVAVPVGGAGLWQEALNKGVTAIVAGGLAWYIRKKYAERQERGNKLEKSYKALFGVDDVGTMEGVVEIIEAHDDDIGEIFKKLQAGKEKRKEIENRVETIKSNIDRRHGD